MPFSSKKQMRWMFANKPSMAHRWAHHTKDIKSLPESKGKSKKGEKKANALLDGPLSHFFNSKEGRSSRPDRYTELNEALSRAYRHPDTHFGSVMTPLRVLYESMDRDPHPALKVDSGDPQSPRSNYTVKKAFKAGFLLRCAEENLDLDHIEEKIAALEKRAIDPLMGLGEAAGGAVNLASGLGRFALDAGSGLLFGLPALGGAATGYTLAKLRNGTSSEDIKHDDLRDTYLRLADEARRKNIIKRMQEHSPGSLIQLA